MADRILLVRSQFNQEITSSMADAARKYLIKHGVAEDKIDLVEVPGAFELPLAAQQAAKTERYQAIVCLACVVRGDTDHFDYVCKQAQEGLGDVMLCYELPVVFGVLTTNTVEQARQRSGLVARVRSDEDKPQPDNKGADAAACALHMIGVVDRFAEMAEV